MADLQAFTKKFEKAVHDGSFVAGQREERTDPFFTEMSLEKYITDLYFPSVGHRLSPNTVKFYHKVCDQFLIPSFGHLRLSEITHRDLQAFIDFLAYETERRDGEGGTGLSPATVKRYATVFQSVMTQACRDGFIETNPLRHDSITYPKIQPTQLDVYTQDEIRQFCSALSEEPPMTRLLLLTPLLLGLRRAEMVALRWSDVDMTRRTVSIDRSAYKMPGEEQGLKAPKSQHGVRKVCFPEVYAAALTEWRTAQETVRQTAGDKWHEEDYIFTNETGGMISVYTPTRICEKFQERHGLRHLKLHGLRHTCGSMMVALGADPETVRDVLGHDSVKTTDIYLHPLDQSKRKAADLLGGIIGGDEKCG